MKSDIGEVYDELSILLNDICNFLKDEAAQLSPIAALKASELIKRSKTKLVEISKILPDNDSSRYMDMTAATPEKKEESIPEYFDPDAKPKLDEQPPEIYSDIDAKQELQSENQTTCPYNALSAKSLPREKIDYIERKTKILFFDHYRKLYAGIIDDWMLLYYSDKDNKPFEVLHLKQYDTRMVEKKQVVFELVPKDGNSRVHTFAASTRKDMLQWISVINRKSIASKPLPRTPNEVTNTIEEEPEIYEELGNESGNRELPVATPNSRRSAEDNYYFLDSPDDIYDPIGNSNANPNNTEHGYDSEEHYDTITPHQEQEEEEIYDTIGHAAR